jgi:nicotinate-nucleotide adenylyltransferase
MKTGLYFGSFNPIHIGHLAVANYMVEFTDLDDLWFVVSPHNPLKSKSVLLSDERRLRMVELALDGDLRFRASDVELQLPRPSYTIDTLHFLEATFPEREFIVIMGSDGLPTFDQWKEYKQIEEKYKRYIYPRPGFPVKAETTPNIVLANAPQMDISSTFIRMSVQQGKDVRYFVPEKVWEYILAENLFR